MPLISAAEARVLDCLDDETLIQSLVDLVRVPSITGSDAESSLQHAGATQLAAQGLDVDTWKFDLDELTSHPQFPGTEAPRLEGYGLVAVLGGNGIPALVLQGHVDVVPTGDLDKWRDRDPFSAAISGNVLHGRGACDMKAGYAANLAVAAALSISGARLERPLAIHSVVSEEDGGLGAFATMLRGHGGEAAVLTEPTSGRIITANAGALTFRISVPGRAAHGSTRLEGVSAIDSFLPILSAIHELERERNSAPDPVFLGNPLPYPISVGQLRAGDWASSVPDLLIADGRYGVQLGEDPEAARAVFANAIASASAADPWLRDNPPSLTWPGGQFASGQLRGDHPLISEVSDAITDSTGGPAPQRAGAPYGSDLRLYSNLGGIPTLHYGPGDVKFAHAPREQVNLDELVAVTRSLLV
ncbi:MAG TPA: ArgE/DapE family deacylase, partial [Galbitalea sp.]